MEYDLLYKLNPRLSMPKVEYDRPVFDRPERPIGRANYQNNYVEFGDASRLNVTIDDLIRMQKAREMPPSQRTIFDLAKYLDHDEDYLNAERQVALRQARVKGPRENTGQQYENEIIGDMFNNQVENQRAGTEMAQHLTEEHFAREKGNGRRRK